jgi:hypothetical protein
VATSRAEVERWFVRRGVPHLIEGYSAEANIWTRARPFLIAVLLFQTSLAFNDRFRGLTQALVFGATALGLLAAVAFFNRWRGRHLFDVPREVDWPELAFFVVAPALIALAVSGDGWQGAVALLGINVAMLAAIYVVVGFGLIPLTFWAVGDVVGQLRTLARLVTRTLPTLLLLTMFMFINAEIWQVSHTVGTRSVISASVVVLAIGLAFLWSSTRRMLDEVSAFESWAEVCDAACETPTSEVTPPAGDFVPTALTRAQNANLRAMMTMSLVVQVTMVAAGVALFYVLIGNILVNDEVVTQWLAGPTPHVWWQADVGGMRWAMTTDHFRVATLIGTIAGLSVAVSAISDATFREETTANLVAEARENLAARALYQSIPR